MDCRSEKKLTRLQVGAIPLIRSIAERMVLATILSECIPQHGNEHISAVDTIMLLVYNVTLGKEPLYKLEDWTRQLDYRCVGVDGDSTQFNDDRFGRALGFLYCINHPSLARA